MKHQASATDDVRLQHEIEAARKAIDLVRQFPIKGGPVPPKKTSWFGSLQNKQQQPATT